MGDSYLLIEGSEFTDVVSDYFETDEDYAQFQFELARAPEKGQVIPGAAPLRKLRWGDARRGKGKRGGLRVIYIHIVQLRVLYLLDVYGKDEVDDLTNDEKKDLRRMAKQLVEELTARKRRGRL